MRCLCATLLLLLLFAFPARAATLSRIRQTGTLRCGINVETPEYSTSDDHGPRQAFDADLCRAVAIAILGPNGRIAVSTYPDDVATMAALTSGKVDLLPTLTDDFSHSSDQRLTFSPPALYDGVGFLVPLNASIAHANELGGKKICFLAETQVEVALRAWFARQHLKLLAFPFQEEGEMEAAFVTGNCTALAGDRTRLASTRTGFGPLASRYDLLPESISLDPLAAASRSDDPAFAAIVRWTIEVLLNAEAAGFTQHTIAAPPSSSDPTVRMLSGHTGEIGSRLGLDNTWAVRVLSAIGNYGEIYDRDLGGQSPFKLPRAFNRLSNEGGLMVPLPLE